MRLSDKFAAEFYARHDHQYSGAEIAEWLRKQEAPCESDNPACPQGRSYEIGSGEPWPFPEK